MSLITISSVLGLLMLVMVPKAENYELSLKLLCKGKAADIVFVLDSSSSIWAEHFDKQLAFVKYMIEHFDIGEKPNQIRIGVVTFSDTAKIHINLNSVFDKSNLIWKIDQIPQILGNTSIGNGLREMRDTMFTRENGARPGVRHVGIVLTDGISQDEDMTQREAKASRRANIELFVIGIGNISRSELHGIASKPKEKHLFLTASYTVLDQIRNDVIKETCEQEPTEIKCKGEAADMVFVLDASSSIWREHFQKQLDFVKYMIDRLDIGGGPKQVQIGVETFSDLAHIQINLNNGYSKPVLKWKIDQIPQKLGSTSIGDALREMRNIMYTSSNGVRPAARKVAIILTDGTSQDKHMAQMEAKLCRDANIELFVIGIGNYISHSELEGIASKPTEKFLFKSPSYEILDKIREVVLKQTCEGVILRPRPPRPPSPSNACNAGTVTEVVFMINNNHFGQVKTTKILKATDEIIKRVRKHNNVHFGIIFDNHLRGLDLAVGSINAIAHLDRDFVNYRFGPFVSLINKLRNKVFYGRTLNARRIGFLFIDSTVELNVSELRLEAKRLSFEVIELYAAVIGDVHHDIIENTLVPEQHIIRISSFDNLIHELPPLFSEMVCKPFKR